MSRFDFRCEAYNDCRVGTLGWTVFNGITVHSTEVAFKRFHENDLKQWYRLLLRSTSFLSLGLHERIAITLLELASDFGIKESRGVLLRASFSHQDLADLVGASRPRVTEQLAQLEREHLIVRQGRQLIVRVDEIGTAMTLPSLSRLVPPAPAPRAKQPPPIFSKALKSGRHVPPHQRLGSGSQTAASN